MIMKMLSPWSLSDKDMAAEVRKICGGDACTNFENPEYEDNDHFPSDEDSSSYEEELGSDQDVEEVFNECDVKNTGAAQSEVCAAGNLCGMKDTPWDGLHHCINCAKSIHGVLCGINWSERDDDCKVSADKLTARGKLKIKNHVTILICAVCVKECSAS